jgi:hypothetical protein
MAKIEVAGSLNVGTVNTVLDERSRINRLSDVANIPLPAIGALFYCVENGKTYIIKSLKSKLVNGYNIANAEVDQYEEFGGGNFTARIEAIEETIGNLSTTMDTVLEEL